MRWALRLGAFALLGIWMLTWALDAPHRPILAERDAIFQATVHVSGMACDRFSEGHGFAVEPELVLTNAHVVSGVDEITVTTAAGGSAAGTLVGFDPSRDVAAILVSGLDLTPVKLAKKIAMPADAGDVVTFDQSNGINFAPFSVKRRIWVSGRDIYGELAQNRQVLEIQSVLVTGDSGAGLVNVDGELWGMVFAVDLGQRKQGYALDVVEIFDFLTEVDSTPLPTQPCRL